MYFRESRTALRAGTLMLVLVVGGCQRRNPEAAPAPRDASGEAATVTSDGRVPNESVEKMLQGKIAGVRVTTTPDGSIAVRIRGASSAYGNNDPLYIVDGLPVQPGANGALAGISPNDIESIKVLKDAADIAMYGSRGANGVIIVKTKRPSP